MLRRAGRIATLLAAVLTMGLLTTGSLAIARGRDNSSNQRGLVRQHCTARQFSAWDEQSLMTSIEGDRFEIQGGRLAQQRSDSRAIRALGATLVADHGRSLAEAAKLARRLGIAVPSEPSPTQQWELKTIATFSGGEFDRRYADLEVLDHMQDISETRAASEDGCNASLRRNARRDLPVLERHLDLSQRALRAVS